MEALADTELCFPHLNTSCRRMRRPHLETTLIYCVLSCITLLTVLLNLLVIISISHFRQLHTTTNLLLLSLAVADFIVGLLQMPLMLLNSEGCWFLGDFMCVLYCYTSCIFLAVSVGNMVLISVDRYIAICDSMFYTTKVTLSRVKLCVCLCWIFATVHSSWMVRDFLKHPNRYNTCYGDCILYVNLAEGVVDLVVYFLGPILVIVLLYLRVFVVAVSQARAMRSHIAAVRLERSETVKAKKSEMKAARTLGIVVVVFLLCSCPYYCFAVASETNLVSASSASIEILFLFLNSSLNPVIYVFFYPWFRKTSKHIVTLQILQPGSSQTTLM